MLWHFLLSIEMWEDMGTQTYTLQIYSDCLNLALQIIFIGKETGLDNSSCKIMAVKLYYCKSWNVLSYKLLFINHNVSFIHHTKPNLNRSNFNLRQCMNQTSWFNLHLPSSLQSEITSSSLFLFIYTDTFPRLKRTKGHEILIN